MVSVLLLQPACTSLLLTDFGEFLQGLKIGNTGQAFLIDQQGQMIANS